MSHGSGLEEAKRKRSPARARARRVDTTSRPRDVAIVLLLAAGYASGCTSSTDPDDAAITTADAGAPVPTSTPTQAPSTEPEATPDAGDEVSFGPGEMVDVPEPSTPATPDPVLPPGYEGPTVENPIVTCEAATAEGEDPLIDDFESLGIELRAVDGREGTWYWYDDGTATATQEVTWTEDSPAVSGTATLHAAGGPFPQYSGVGFGPRWTVTGPEFCSYDASAYDGFTFWARGTGSVRVGLQTPEVRPLALGGQCPDDASCFDSHGMDFTVTDDWRQYWVSFDEAEQAGWGTPVGEFDPSAIYVIEFQFPLGNSYDIYLDDVAFFSGEPTTVTPPDGGTAPGEPIDGGMSDSLDAGASDSDGGTEPANLDASALGDAG